MGNSESQKITKPQESLIVSVQHKELESIHDCEELRQLKQLPKTVPLRPSTSYPFQSNNPNSTQQPNPAHNIRKSSLSDPINNKEIRENDIDSTQSQQSNNNSIHKNHQFLLTPSLIGSNYSNASSLTSAISKSNDESVAVSPFNPNALRPPKLGAEGLDMLYKHLRVHFTSLAVKVDCNQVSCTFQIQEMDEELAITRANMIDIDYTTNQIQKTISSMKLLCKQILILRKQCADAVTRCNLLWQLLPNTSPRSLSIFDPSNKIRKIIMEGAMVRLGSYLKGSKKRWVILYIDGLMAYYNGERQSELKGVIDLYNATEVIPSDISHLMITVRRNSNSSKLNSWHFKCPSPQHVTKWLDAIRSLHFIRARSKLKYCENIPTQFLRDNRYNFLNIKDNIKQCLFNIIHLFNICGYCYQCILLTNNNIFIIKLKGYLQQYEYDINNNDESSCIDWNQIRYKFDEINDDYTYCFNFKCTDEIISIKYCAKLKQIFYATKNCIKCVFISDILNAIQNKSIEITSRDIFLSKDNNSIQRIGQIGDICIINYSNNSGIDISVIFICDSIEHCLWCLNLNENYPIIIRLINTPSPNNICEQNNILYITSLQCGIYYISLRDIDFNKAFSSPSFFTPFCAKGLQIFENIVLKQIQNMPIPPNDLLPFNKPIQSGLNTSIISNSAKSQSPGSTFSISNDENNQNIIPNMLFVIDIEYQLYMIRLTDLVLISFGIIENIDHIFYYSKFDNLYITRPQLNKIQCITNIYHEIVSVRGNTNSVLFGTPTHSSVSIEEIKENYNNNNNNLNTQLQKVNTVKPCKSSDSNHKHNKHNHNHNHKHNKHNSKKHLSNADIKALMHNDDDIEIDNQHMKKKQTKKICFPKSLYLVYQIQNENENHNSDSDNNNNNNIMNMDCEHVEMEILVEVDNMLQSYMLSELRQHSKKLLNYTKRNYSFLYLYTSPYDGQSMYRELDKNYESSVPAKNLIQHSSIGPVILVKLKPPTKEQIKKQKERDAKIKKRKNKQKNKKINHP